MCVAYGAKTLTVHLCDLNVVLTKLHPKTLIKARDLYVWLTYVSPDNPGIRSPGLPSVQPVRLSTIAVRLKTADQVFTELATTIGILRHYLFSKVQYKTKHYKH